MRQLENTGSWMVNVGGANGAVLFLIETPGNDGALCKVWKEIAYLKMNIPYLLFSYS